MAAADDSGMVNTGSADGFLQVENGAAMWRDDTFDCTLKFAITDDAVTIQQEGPCGFGINVIADGRYVKK